MEKLRCISFVRSFLLAHRASFFGLVYYLRTRCEVFELTTQRFKITSGVFTKTTETLVLYRVKDIETRQPFFPRLVGIENVQMTLRRVLAVCFDRSCAIERRL